VVAAAAGVAAAVRPAVLAASADAGGRPAAAHAETSQDERDAVATEESVMPPPKDEPLPAGWK